MARRWTPQRFVTLRRIRVIAGIAATSIALAGSFAFTARKSVALNINGQTTQVTTYAMTATRLLEEQGVDIKTHDIVTTSSGDQLANHAVVTVQSAYQTTINIDGTAVPFWTVATSADQLLGFFEENQNNAAKITVDIKNVYNQLTGGLVINQSGPVTVIADGKSSVAPNGKLPAASILDSKGIVLNKEDRVSVEKDGDETILRVCRVTHGEETRTSMIPFSTQTIIDPNLAEGQAEVRQQGVNGEKTQVYDVTYVDGVAESETLKSETVTSMAIDQIIAMAQAAEREPDVALTITKRIPVGAGLGGGSADAAATMLAVNRLWELNWPIERLRTIATTLGADMPFCLTGGLAYGTGFGERITDIAPGSRDELALIEQGFSGEVLVGAYQSQLSTPEVYHTFDIVGAAEGDRNHLQAAAISLHPRSGQAIDAATQAGASHAFVSGSGPSVVAFAADEAAAQRIIEVWRDTAVVDRIIRAKSPEHPNISVRQ